MNENKKIKKVFTSISEVLCALKKNEISIEQSEIEIKKLSPERVIVKYEDSQHCMY